MKKLMPLLVLSALAALGADVTGKWSGSFKPTDGDSGHDDTAYMTLTQDGSKITGTVGPRAERQHPIRKGAIEGDKVTLEVTPGDGPDVVYFELVLDGDRLMGTARGEHDGHKLQAKVDVKREK